MENKVIELLKNYGASVEPADRSTEDAYIVRFHFERGVTTLRIVLNDYSGADLVITNMTTLPESHRRHGFGSKALETILLWARSNDLKSVRAVQILKQSEYFWIKNGFARCEEPNPCNDFIYQEPVN
ncbi:MAG: GNAT family N-acetyltransferase [bacterium]|nr:GNAT family N-acetyltransferase [bacterium]